MLCPFCPTSQLLEPVSCLDFNLSSYNALKIKLQLEEGKLAEAGGGS